MQAAALQGDAVLFKEVSPAGHLTVEKHYGKAVIGNFDRDMQGPGMQKSFCFYAGFSEEEKRGLNEAGKRK